MRVPRHMHHAHYIDSSNRKASFGKFFGNVTKKYLGGEIFITIHVYNRLTPKMTISDIDKLTSSLNERELIELFKDKLISVFEIYL